MLQKGDKICQVFWSVSKGNKRSGKHIDIAPEEFCITGDFLLDENQNEKISVKKKEILEKMDLWINLCRKAVVEDAKILHNGI